MPLFRFNIRNGLGFTRDPEGKELPDAAAARDVAVTGARSLISAEVLEGRLDLRGRIEVTDGDGRLILAVRFSEAVEVEEGELSIQGDQEA